MYAVFRRKYEYQDNSIGNRGLFVCEFPDYHSIGNFLSHCHEQCIGTYECLFAFTEYVTLPNWNGGTFSNNANVYLGWKEWLAHGWHQTILNGCSLSSANSVFAAIEGAVSFANAFGSGPLQIDSDIDSLRHAFKLSRTIQPRI